MLGLSWFNPEAFVTYVGLCTDIDNIDIEKYINK